MLFDVVITMDSPFCVFELLQGVSGTNLPLALILVGLLT